METPHYLQILWRSRWLLIFGIVVAVAAGLLAGFTVRGGEIVTRAERTYTAATTIMLEGEQTTLLQAVIPGEEIDQTTTTASVRQDLGAVAVLYAYLAASQEMVERVEASVGELTDDEQVTAVSRTTQPAGDERFPGRLELPIIDILGIATDPERAEQLSRSAAREFGEYIVEQQQTELIPTETRVQLRTLNDATADEGVGGNPAVPIIVTTGGVLLGFIALIYIINGIRSRRGGRGAARRERRAARASARRDDPVRLEDEPEPELVGVSRDQSVRD